MTRILFVYGRISRSKQSTKEGGGDYLFNLARATSDLGNEVHALVADGPSGTDGSVHIHNLGINWLEPESPLKCFSLVRSFLANLGPQQIILVHPDGIKHHVNLGLYSALLYQRAAPLSIISFSIGLSRKKVLEQALFLLLTIRARNLLFSDPDTMSRLTSLAYIRKKSSILNVGSNLTPDLSNSYSQRNSHIEPFLSQSTERFISYFGYIGKEKGTDALIDAFNIAGAQRKDVKLLIICGLSQSAYEATILEKIQSYALTDRVIFSGYCSPEDCDELLRKSLFVVLPFKDNVIGRSSLAAALLSNGVVLTNKPRSSWPPLQHEVNIYFAPNTTAEALSDSILHLLTSEELCHDIRRNAKGLSAHFEWTSIAKKLERLIAR